MYWPIGPPKAYALSKRKTAPPITHSQDGLGGSQEEVGSSAGSEEQEARVNGSANTHNGEDDESRRNSAASAAVTPTGQDEEILAAKISRGGSVFASITRSQLTVWQTKPAVALAGVIRSQQ